MWHPCQNQSTIYCSYICPMSVGACDRGESIQIKSHTDHIVWIGRATSRARKDVIFLIIYIPFFKSSISSGNHSTERRERWVFYFLATYLMSKQSKLVVLLSLFTAPRFTNSSHRALMWKASNNVFL